MRNFVLMSGLMAACAGPKADLILRNGVIVTLDDAQPRATAVAVRGDRIVQVGSDGHVAAWRGSTTRVIDLDGATVVPGLVDAHAHIELLGNSLEELDLRGTRTPEAVATLVERAAKSAQDDRGGWIVGRGWDQNDWPAAQFPDTALLDSAAPGRPVALTRIDGHSLWVSREALRIAGITRETPDPPGGRILRAAQGEPTGTLIDEAMELVLARVPPPDLATRERRIRLALERIAAMGLTGVHDMGVDDQGYGIFRRLADQGSLKVRVYAVASSEDAASLVESQPDVTPWVTRRAVKLFVDGALGSRGAALLEPYSDDPDNRGLVVTSRERIEAISKRALANGWQVSVHAIGDRGNRMVLDAFEQAVGERRDHRFRIEHAQVLHADDIPRFARLGVIASMQPMHWTSDSPWAPARLGAERMTGAYAWKTIRSTGAVVAFGSDFPVEEPNPLLGFLAAIQRPREGLDRTAALRGYTQGAAYAGFAEQDRGTIRVGMFADLTVFGGDLMGAPQDQLARIPVRWTVVGGKIVYDSTVHAEPPRERTFIVR